MTAGGVENTSAEIRGGNVNKGRKGEVSGVHEGEEMK